MGVVCYRISGVLKALTPLHIGLGIRTGVIKRCRNHIPGAVLRGAVGTALIKSVCKLDMPIVNHEKCDYFDDCVYAQLFGEEFGKSSKIFFRYAYPLHLKCGGVFQPTPKTLYRCSNPQCRRVFNVFVAPDSCDLCQGSVKPFSGFICSECGELEREPLRISRITLTAVDRVKGSAAQISGSAEEAGGTLHTLEVIDAGSRFNFEIIIHREAYDSVELIKNLLERALPDEGLGAAKSRGLGKVQVEEMTVEKVETSLLEKRSNNIDVKNFKVKLVSPLILDGKTLDPSSLLEAARRAYSWAFQEGKHALPEVKLKRWAVDGELFSGWSLKTNKRRRIESAVSAGSIFEFECSSSSKELALSLSALEFYAIGAYKPHGCGQIHIEKA
ncbi:MAG: RAMP superfamily CRISPR-associated protein [Candidatus Norongarragalinales archaeon]